MDMMMGPMMGWAWILLSTALLVVLAVGAVFMVRAVIERDGPSSSSAVRILEERFARGEIDRDEFAERKAALRS